VTSNKRIVVTGSSADNVHLFLDFDDTISDYIELGGQYVTRLASLLSSEFGGTDLEWASILPAAIAASLDRYAKRFGNKPQPGFAAWAEDERARVVSELFDTMNRTLPLNESPVSLVDRLQWGALTSCCAPLPGARAALAEISESGVRVHMASSWGSKYLLAALIGADLDTFVETKFGPDLVDCPKEGPEFYRRIFRKCDIQPHQAIVLDDQVMCLDWAEEAGARVIQVCIKSDSRPEFPISILNLSDLPAALRVAAGQSN
jgi:phosphoglycolate phosphatase-like HAD superfamily hydrolase